MKKDARSRAHLMQSRAMSSADLILGLSQLSSVRMGVSVSMLHSLQQREAYRLCAKATWTNGLWIPDRAPRLPLEHPGSLLQSCQVCGVPPPQANGATGNLSSQEHLAVDSTLGNARPPNPLHDVFVRKEGVSAKLLGGKAQPEAQCRASYLGIFEQWATGIPPVKNISRALAPVCCGWYENQLRTSFCTF
jgi:hypothetical protein